MGGTAIVILAAAQGFGAPAFAPQVEVARPAVELGQVLDLERLPPALRRRAATLEVARFRPEQKLVVTTSQAIAARAREQMPVLGPWLASAPAVTISIRRNASSDQPAAEPSRCLKLTQAVPAGSYPTLEDFQPASCYGEPQVSAAFHYDRHVHTVRAERDLAPGDIVRAPPAFALAVVRPAERLYLTAHVGPVVVTREVEAVQPAPAGGALFVKAQDGSVFAAPVPEKAQ